MKEKIIDAAEEMFLNYGFKSVTMDDIADKLGISKKTIYAHYSTKNKLVEAAGHQVLQTVTEGIDKIRARKLNPVIENFEIKRFVNQHLKGEKTSPHFQLKKYYPKVFVKILSRQFELLQNCVSDNLARGLELGYYRPELDPRFISRIHFVGMMGIKDKELFPAEEYSESQLMHQFLEYHLRAICTPEGVKILDEFLESHEK